MTNVLATDKKRLLEAALKAARFAAQAFVLLDDEDGSSTYARANRRFHDAWGCLSEPQPDCGFADLKAAMSDLDGAQTKPVVATISYSERQIQDAVRAVLTQRGDTVQQWIFINHNSGDRHESGSVSATVDVRLPGGINGKKPLTEAELKEIITTHLTQVGYAVASVRFSYDPPTGCQLDPGNGVTASIAVTSIPAK